LAIAEITVLGGGIFGLSIAWACAKRGAKVRLIERQHIGAGSSGGLVGALAPHTPENWNDKKAFQLDSLLMAERWWSEIEAAGGIDPGYARLGRLQTIADARAMALAEARIAGADLLWRGQAVWRLVEDGDFAGWAPASPTGKLIHDTLSARLDPRRAGAALAAALRSIGAEIVEGRGDPIGQVIEATGVAGLDELTAHFGRTVGNGVKGQAAILAHDAQDKPQLFLDSVHFVPHGDGQTAIGSTSERDFDNAGTTDAQLDALIAKARRLCPALEHAEVLERWAGVRPRGRSRAPMLGRHPIRPEHFIANGGFKIGFGMAPKVAEVMADLVLEGRDNIPEGFQPEASL